MKEKKFRLWDKKTNTLTLKPTFGHIVKGVLWPLPDVSGFTLTQWSGLQDSKGVDIYEGDIVYLAGYGDYEVEFPFIELYESGMENYIGAILGNIYDGLK